MLKKSLKLVVMILVIAMAFSLLLAGCGDDKGKGDNSVENITTDWKIMTYPTTTTTGTLERTKDGKVETLILPVLSPENYTVEVVKDATCGETGEIKYTFKNAEVNVNFSVKTDATHKHTYVYVKNDKEHYLQCVDCKDKKPAEAHVFNAVTHECVCTKVDPKFITKGVVYELNKEKTEYTVVGYNGKATDVVIADLYEGKPVTAISDKAFKGNKALTSVVIPADVKTIAKGAFEDCTSLAKIVVPFISTDADGRLCFGNIFGASNSRENAKYIPASLKTVVVREGEAIGGFTNATSIESVVLSSNAKVIESGAFGRCNNLKSIDIPYGVEKIGRGALSGCTSLESLSVAYLGETKVSEGKYLGHIFGASYVEENSSFVPASLKTVIIKNAPKGDKNVVAFDLTGFTDCNSIEQVIIPDNTVSVMADAFKGCTSLKLVATKAKFDELSKPAAKPDAKAADNKETPKVDVNGIYLPKDVKSIGASAFEGCLATKSISIPAAVTTIGAKALYGMSSLEAIAVDNANKVYKADGNTLILKSGNVVIKGIATSKIPSGVKEIGEYAFKDVNISAVVIPDSVVTIKNGAFQGSNVKDLTIGKGVQTIETNAFSGCNMLAKIVIPASTKTIGANAFSGAGSAAELTFANGSKIESIGSFAFNGCDAILKADIPSNIKTIGQGAFRGCSALTSISVPFIGGSLNSGQVFGYIFGADFDTENRNAVPSSLKTIVVKNGNVMGGFRGIKNVESITLPNNATTISANAFRDITSLKTLTIPATVTEIGSGAFANTGITTITIPAKVNSIGESVLANATNLNNIVVAKGNAKYSGENGCLIEKETNTIIAGSKTAQNIPGTAVIIGKDAFRGLPLASINIPATVKEIRDNAFVDCANLKTVSIPTSVDHIGHGVFAGCTAISSLTIPYLGERLNGNNAYISYLFGGDGSSHNSEFVPSTLKTVIVKGGTTFGGFGGASNIENITLPESTLHIAGGAFDNCFNLQAIVIPAGTQTIGNGAFTNCAKVTNIVIPANVSSIGRDAFKGCVGLQTVTVDEQNATYKGDAKNKAIINKKTNEIVLNLGQDIADGIEVIAANSFRGSDIKEVVIPASVKVIESNAFRDCTSLTKVTFANNSKLTTISSYAFSGCSALANIVIPSSVVTIESSAFADCSKLNSITFQYDEKKDAESGEITIVYNIKTIGGYAFAGSSALEVIEIPNSVESIGQNILMGADHLKKMVIPFIGENSTDAVNTSAAYIFGGKAPRLLNNVVINGGKGIGGFAGCEEITTIDIPKTVEVISDNAFADCTKLSSVTFNYDEKKDAESGEITIVYNINTIGQGAFSGCTALKEIAIPDEVTVIGDDTFKGCTSLTKVVMPKDVRIIGKRAFLGDTKLATLDIPFGTIVIDDEAFKDCSALTTIVIPASVESVGASAFVGVSVKEINIEFAEVPVSWSKNWKDATMPIKTSYKESVTGDKLYNYVIHNDKVYITKYNGKGVALVTIPDTIAGKTVVSFGNVFRDNKEITEIVAPNTIERMYKGAFSGCDKLAKLTIPFIGADVKNTGDENFSYIFDGIVPQSLDNITVLSATSRIDENKNTIRTLDGFAGLNNVRFINLPSEVDVVASGAFKDCGKLQEVVLSANVKTIGKGAFEGCDSLQNITLPFVGASLDDFNNMKFGYIFGQFVPKSIVNVTILGGIIVTGFDNLPNLTTVSIAQSVEVIGNSAFKNANNLTTVTFAPGTKLNMIESYAFSGCSALRNIDIPLGVVSMGNRVFENCASELAIAVEANENAIPAGWASDWNISRCAVTYGNGEVKTDANFNYRETGLGDVYITVYKGVGGAVEVPATLGGLPVTGIGKVFVGNDQITSLVLPNSIEYLEPNALKGCVNITNLTIPFVGPDAINAKGAHLSFLFGEAGIPAGLKSVTILGGENISGFSDIATIESVTLPSSTKRILPETFRGCTLLQNVTIPSGVEYIGDAAFMNATTIDTVDIPATVTTLGVDVFKGCTSLANVTISDSVTVLPDGAFSGCAALTSITIPSTTTSIGSGTFNGCALITTINIPATVTSIAPGAFAGMVGLENITVDQGNTIYKVVDNSLIEIATNKLIFGIKTSVIPEDVKIIGKDAFMGSLITSVIIPANVISIEDSAFANCSALQSVTFATKLVEDKMVIDLKSIGANAFSGTAITDIKIPSSVVSIGEGAFSNANVLASIELPFIGASLDAVEPLPFNYVFGGVVPASLKNVVILAGDSIYGFKGANSIETLKFNGNATKVADYALSGMTALQNIQLPVTVETIGAYAFEDCKSLKALDIPKNVTYIGTSILKGANVDTLTSKDNSKYIIDGKSLIEVEKIEVPTELAKEFDEFILKETGKNKSELTEEELATFKEKHLNQYILKDTGKNKAELSQEELEAVTNKYNKAITPSYITHKILIAGVATSTIPNDIYSIAAYAFNGQAISEIVIPASVKYIENHAFFGCNSLTKVTFAPNSVLESIGESAFEGTMLDSVIIPDSVIAIEKNVFKNVNINNLVLPINNSATKIVDLFGTLPASLKTIRVTKSNEIAIDTFKGAKGVNNVIIESGVMGIQPGAFADCINLNSITLPFVGSRYNIDGSVFTNTSFASIFGSTIPYSLKRVELVGITSISGFENIKNVNEIVLPNTLKTIEANAFKNCTDIISITIPNSVETIKAGAFEGCNRLVSIEIPSSVTSIEAGAFKGADDLKSITLPFAGTSPSTGCLDDIFGGKPVSLDTVIINNTANILAQSFAGADYIKNLSLVGNVQSIEMGALKDLASINTLVVPFVGGNLANVEKNAFDYIFNGNVPQSLQYVTVNSNGKVGGFAGLKWLLEVSLPNATAIDTNAFNGCTGLRNIVINGNIISVGANAFANTRWYNNQNDGLVYMDYIFLGYKGIMPENVELSIKYGTRIIADNAIQSNNIVKLTIPSTVTNLNKNVFRGCDRLTEITLPFAGTSALSGTIDDLFGGKPVSLEKVTITNTANVIAQSFVGADYIKNLSLVGEIQSIEKGALNGLTNIETLVVPFVGGNLANVEKNAFGYIFNDNVPVSLKYVTLTNGEVVDGFAGLGNIVEVVLPTNAKSIAANAFSGCVGLQKVVIPASVTSIGDNAFSGCTKLNNIVLNGRIESISGNAFDNTGWYNNQISGLVYLDDILLGYKGVAPINTQLIIKDGTRIIADGALQSNENIIKVTIPASVTIIGKNAFKGCTKLNSVVLGNGVESIGANAFDGCIGLKEIIIPSSVQTIDASAFANNTDLKIYARADKASASWAQGWNGDSKVFLYSATEPTTSGNFWHEDKGAIVEWPPYVQK